MGIFLFQLGYDNSAEIVLRRTIEVAGTVGVDVASTMSSIYAHQGKFLEAGEILHLALQEIEQVHGRNSCNYAYLLDSYAYLLSEQGLIEEAAKAEQAALSIYITLYGSEHVQTLVPWISLSGYLLASSKYREALSANNNAFKVLRVTVGMHHYLAASAYSDRAQILTELGEYSAAEENFRIALPIAEECSGDKSPKFVTVATHFAGLLRQINKLEESKKLLERVLKAPLLDRQKGQLYSILGSTYAGLNNYEQANSCMKKSLDILERLLGPQHLAVAGALMNLGALLVEQNKLQDGRYIIT